MIAKLFLIAGAACLSASGQTSTLRGVPDDAVSKHSVTVKWKHPVGTKNPIVYSYARWTPKATACETVVPKDALLSKEKIKDTTFTDHNVKAGATYCYAMRSYDESTKVYSTWSAPIMAVVPEDDHPKQKNAN